MPSLYIPYQVIIQLPNSIQPPHWEAPVLLAGAQVVTDVDGNPVYQPAHQQRPMADDEFGPEMLDAINGQLAKLGMVLSKTPT